MGVNGAHCKTKKETLEIADKTIVHDRFHVMQLAAKACPPKDELEDSDALIGASQRPFFCSGGIELSQQQSHVSILEPLHSVHANSASKLDEYAF